MKELSIEEKAKRYDALFVKAQQIYNKENDVLILHTIEDLFPELAESDDERIKQWLIEMVKEVRKANPTNAEHNGMCSKAIAWLEKQAQNLAWSEEDEFELENVLCHLRNYLHKDSYIRYENWLKSLKNRVQSNPKWKPSDEQMKCLSDVVHKAKYNNDISVGGYSAYMPLASLYLDLKKLKE